MTDPLATVPATNGNNYHIHPFGPDVYLIRRDTGHRLMVGRADICALTDALIDVTEGEP